MTKKEILQTFEDINLVYNDCTRYDTLKRMLDELQEPCEDCVSKQGVAEILFKYVRPGDDVGKAFVEFLVSQINDLPPVNPQPKTDWIPVSERLPNVASVFRVTRYFPNNVMNPNYLVDACFFDGSNTWYNDNRINHERAYVNNVIAWQEDPEPYEPQESEGKE